MMKCDIATIKTNKQTYNRKPADVMIYNVWFLLSKALLLMSRSAYRKSLPTKGSERLRLRAFLWYEGDIRTSGSAP